MASKKRDETLEQLLQEESKKISGREHYCKFVVDLYVPVKAQTLLVVEIYTTTRHLQSRFHQSFCWFKQWHSFAWRLFFCTIRKRFSSCCHMSDFPVLLEDNQRTNSKRVVVVVCKQTFEFLQSQKRLKGFRREPLVAASFL